MTTSITLPHNGWQPREDQLPFWRALLDPSLETVVQAAHRRWGKDECCLHYAAVQAHTRVGTIWHALPQYNQCRKAIWEQVNPRTGRRRIFDAFPEPLIENIDEQSMRIRFKNNSTWQLVGSDQTDSLIGASPIAIIFSEAAVADPTSFNLFKPILLENNGKDIYISTPRGRNAFYNIMQAAKSNPDAYASIVSALDTNVFTADQLRKERLRLIQASGDVVGNALFEQEYLCSFEAAILGAVYGPELTSMKVEGRLYPMAYDSRYPVDTSWDLGVRDNTVILFWQKKGDIPHLIDWYTATDLGLDHFAEVLASKPYYYGKHIGPHDVAERSKATALSYAAHAEKLGIRFERMPNTPLNEQIAAASILLRQARFNGDADRPDVDPHKDCMFVYEAISQYRYKYDEKRNILSSTPLHDWTSHYASAMMTYALYHVGNSTYHGGRTQALQGRFDQAPRLSDIHSKTAARRRGAFS